jgi:hypothetical protein
VSQQSNIEASSAAGLCLFVGQHHCGRWVVRDAERPCSRLFTNRNDAIRFAMYESKRHAQSVIMLPNGFEQDGAAPLFTPAQRFAS